MRSNPLLSICVPSRNRQRYFQETIRSLVASLRTDVEFVFSDNSDDPTVMDRFMADVTGDPRVVFLRPESQPLSMRDNWERTVAAASGDWICVIGDDDYADPEMADLIERVLAINPEMDVLAWSRPVYYWPQPRPYPDAVVVELETTVREMSRTHLWARTFYWENANTGVPDSPYTIYHCAVSSALLQKMKARFGGRYFEYPAVDLECALKLLMLGRTFVYSDRPFSVAGICAESNGATSGSLRQIRESQVRFNTDLGHDMERDIDRGEFPFPAWLGNSVVVGQAQHWFRKAYGIEVEGWERNFVRACAISLRNLAERDCYDEAVAEFRDCLSRWKEGRFLADFDPVPYEERRKVIPYLGRVHTPINQRFFVAENIGDSATPAEFFRIVAQMIAPVKDLDIRISTPATLRTGGEIACHA